MITEALSLDQLHSNTLTPEQLHNLDAYWRAANYLSVGQIYLYANPLLKEPLALSHVKPLVVGHWWRTPTSKAPTARSIPVSARMKPDCKSSSCNSRFPVGSTW
jgi:phosphoketolase